MAKFEERIKAREMRRLGWSVRQIAIELGVSKGTSSRWCMDVRLTEEQQKTLLKRDRHVKSPFW